MLNLHSPRVFQSLMVRSREAETICRLSAEKETLRTSPVCPTNFRVVNPVFKSQSRRVLSQEEERANWPSEEIETSETKWLCPWRIFLGKPKEFSSRESCQTMTVLSIKNVSSLFPFHHPSRLRQEKDPQDSPREAVRIMSGFSEEVAMAVTQPEWPARVPLNARGSAIF